VPNIAAEVVDRFLSGRAFRKPQAATAADPPKIEPPAVSAPIQIADFVSEADVRAAIRDSRKIYIGPKTIVTPSARELAAPSDILVVAQG
jgi:hypothetical protein